MWRRVFSPFRPRVKSLGNGVSARRAAMIRRLGANRGYDPLSPGPVDPLSAAQIDQILRPDLSARLAPHGFQTTRRLVWWRDGGDGIRHLVFLSRWKGGAMTVDLGLSLDFVPHVSGARRVVLHRIPAALRPDIRVTPPSQWLDLTSLRGAAHLRKGCAFVLPRAVKQALAFFVPIQSGPASGPSTISPRLSRRPASAMSTTGRGN